MDNQFERKLSKNLNESIVEISGKSMIEYFAGKHTFEQNIPNTTDQIETSRYRTINLIDLVKGCLNPETEVRVWPSNEDFGYWVQYKIPHGNVRLLLSLYYSKKDTPSALPDYIVHLANHPELASIISLGPLREILLDCEGSLAIDIKHVVVDGEHLNAMYVLGKGWQLDSMDPRTAKVMMLLLGYKLELGDWAMVWANYSISMLIDDLRRDHNIALPAKKHEFESERILSMKEAGIEPIIGLEELLA
jgi:hypothetical protein